MSPNFAIFSHSQAYFWVWVHWMASKVRPPRRKVGYRCLQVHPMFVERKVCYSALFTNLVGWHAGAVSFPLSDVILALLTCPLSDIMFWWHSDITNNIHTSDIRHNNNSLQTLAPSSLQPKSRILSENPHGQKILTNSDFGEFTSMKKVTLNLTDERGRFTGATTLSIMSHSIMISSIRTLSIIII